MRNEVIDVADNAIRAVLGTKQDYDYTHVDVDLTTTVVKE